ncbi:hypothetical protein PLICRDRAFT_451363 [Plicaturopsis crispa FD-325 SS-3]|uniref:Uncharacterized protein n=1 Tax=Plicaturopsis crispa FD-325 SS-3 TaxID=944288 RepID=A0A0C9SK99_PLICR|nr:hypothetical protein PLICRDRAFT_451363 [Plicaturopsis crispa FD-325 SS-3]
MGSIAGSLCESTYLLDGGLCRQVTYRGDSDFLYEKCDLMQAALSQVGSSLGGLVTSYGYRPSRRQACALLVDMLAQSIPASRNIGRIGLLHR